MPACEKDLSVDWTDLTFSASLNGEIPAPETHSHTPTNTHSFKHFAIADAIQLHLGKLEFD